MLWLSANTVQNILFLATIQSIQLLMVMIVDKLCTLKVLHLNHVNIYVISYEEDLVILKYQHWTKNEVFH